MFVSLGGVNCEASLKNYQSRGLKRQLTFQCMSDFKWTGRCQCLESVLAWVTAAGWSGQWGQLVHWVRRCSEREAEEFKPRRAKSYLCASLSLSCMCEHLHCRMTLSESH